MSNPANLLSEALTRVTGSASAFSAACREAIAAGRAAVERLKVGVDKASLEETLNAYDRGLAQIGDAGAQASVVRNSHPSEEMRKAAEVCEQESEKALTNLALDRGLYDALSGLKLEGQDPATLKWMEKTLRDFRRSGVDRDEATRARVKALNEELVAIGLNFDRNIRDDVRKVELDAKALEGLPEDYVRAHPPGPHGRVTVTTDYPDSVPFMTYARDGKAREALWRANRMRGYPQNTDVFGQLLAKRHELATLLGYANWAAYVTEDKMIRSERAAGDFIEKITRASEARMKRDYAQLLERKRKESPAAERVEPWEQAYLEDRVRAEKYSFDSQAVRPYLEYRRVKQGVLDTTARMFGITYRRLEGAPVWHSDVEAYEVTQGDRVLGRFYLDMHPREGKYKHAAQFTLATGRAGEVLPEGVLMCNFPKPGAEPALMQHSDVETFFHEFGHLLHHILGGHTRWAGLSGVRTEWDFVEAPSQMLEEWAWDPTSLQAFARHIETDEPIPAEMIKKMRAADEFGKGLWVRQQMFYAALSLNVYTRDPKVLDATVLVRELMPRYTPFDYVEGTYFHLSFGHLNGYSAIYYTYMWSLVIAKDLLTVFKQEGLMNPEPAQRYRRAILEPGGSKDAAVLVHDFLGRDYGFQAYEEWLNAG
ncbi:MAG TPA: M3 family metallopeptidase [Myxococcaceae bacterium]|nr:M3 family metallopeptidase [Myxococcaceae bacterium]